MDVSLPESVKPAPLPPLEAHPCPDSVIRGTASSSAQTAHARPTKWTLAMKSSPARIRSKVYRTKQAARPWIQCG